MAETKTAGKGQPEEKLARVLLVKPGTASEKSLKIVLPDDMPDSDLGKAIDYALGEIGASRSSERIAERVRTEMHDQFGMTLNGKTATRRDPIAYVRKKTEGGIDYLEAEIVIAAKQEGGLEYRSY